MPKIRNISPLGALDVPLLGRVVKASEVVEVTAAQAKALTAQEDTWETVKGAVAAPPAGGDVK